MRENKNRDKRKNEIMDYAMQLFAESGYENITMEHIAEGLNMDVELFYQYFESKQHIYDMVLETYVDICSEDIINTIESNPDVEECIKMLKRTADILKTKSKYSDFFDNNEQFHMQLERKMADRIVPYAVKYLNVLKGRCKIQIDNPVVTAKFIHNSVMAIFGEENLYYSIEFIQNKILRNLYRQDV